MGIPSGGQVYLYAVIPGTGEELQLTGLYESRVYTLTEGEVSAVVSEIPELDRLRPERRHLAAHQGVLGRLVENGGVVLPVSFGTVAESEKGVRRMLSLYQKEFIDQIMKVWGKVEIELRIVYEVENVFEYYVGKSSELRAMRDAVYANGREPEREEKRDLGRLFESVQNAERDDLTARVEQAIRPPCVEVKRNNPRNEKEVMRLSCLLNRGGEEEFKSAVDKISHLFDADFAIEYSGPVPPYSFVEVRVKI